MLYLHLDCLVEDKARKADWDPDDSDSKQFKFRFVVESHRCFLAGNTLIRFLLWKKFGNIGRSGFEGEERLERRGEGDWPIRILF